MKKPLRSSARGVSFHTKHASNANVVQVVLLDANLALYTDLAAVWGPLVVEGATKALYLLGLLLALRAHVQVRLPETLDYLFLFRCLIEH
jgi:hypothetical protein